VLNSFTALLTLPIVAVGLALVGDVVMYLLRVIAELIGAGRE
jgi:hypothetical protein